MQRTATSLIALVMAASVSVPALAQNANTGKTRDEVRAELLDAQRNGTYVLSGTTTTMRSLHPTLFAKPAAVQGKTRAEVKAELIEAQRNGTYVVSGAGQTMRDLHPGLFAKEPAAQGKSRADVQAEVNQPVSSIYSDLYFGD